MDFMSYIIDKCLIVIPVLYIIGAIIKGIPHIPDWLIPFVLLGIGMAACVGLSLRPGCELSLVDALIQGVLVTGAAVFTNQAVKQISKRRDDTPGAKEPPQAG